MEYIVPTNFHRVRLRFTPSWTFFVLGKHEAIKPSFTSWSEPDQISVFKKNKKTFKLMSISKKISP